MKKILSLFLLCFAINAKAQTDSLAADTVMYGYDNRGKFITFAKYHNQNLNFVNMRLVLAKDEQAKEYAQKGYRNAIANYVCLGFAAVSTVYTVRSLTSPTFNSPMFAVSAISLSVASITNKAARRNLTKAVRTFNRNKRYESK